MEEQLASASSKEEPYYSKWLSHMKSPYLSETDDGLVRVEHTLEIPLFQHRLDVLMEDVAAHTMHKIMDHAREKSQLEDFQCIKEPLSALCELWKLTWKQGQAADFKVIKSSQDFTLSINLYVAGCEDALLDSDAVNGLATTVEIAELVVMGLKLLILSCQGKNSQEMEDIIGDNLCAHSEGAQSSLLALFLCLRTLLRILKAARLSNQLPHNAQNNWIVVADYVASALITICDLCRHPKVHEEIVNGVSEELLMMINAGMDLLYDPVALMLGSETSLVPTSLHKGKVEFLVAECLAIALQKMSMAHPDFIDSMATSSSGFELLSVFLLRTLSLSNCIINRPKIVSHKGCQGQSQLQKYLMWTCIQLSDHSVTRPHVLPRLSQVLAQVLIMEDDKFCNRWCGGAESLLQHNEASENTMVLSTATPASMEIRASSVLCNKHLKLFPDTLQACMTNQDLCEAQELALERSILLCRLLWYLSLQAPGEQAGVFGSELCRSMKAILLDGIPHSLGAKVVWSNLSNLLEFLSPLMHFPRENPVIGWHVFESLRKLAWTVYLLSDDKTRTSTSAGNINGPVALQNSLVLEVGI